ncbi:hypothetical protein COK81_13475 [Bacillus thuringiensis]|uniref:Uncharacterized protein n=2 Tax=Bacillus cereus group TaxID=86661 RepID=A0A9X7B0E8_BACTU|nr:hypothetical protein [Bacillus thuringiensis]PFT93959.1 hypothetical protein COK81_13475 [Bacillus thuringiensis]
MPQYEIKFDPNKFTETYNELHGDIGYSYIEGFKDVEGWTLLNEKLEAAKREAIKTHADLLGYVFAGFSTHETLFKEIKKTAETISGGVDVLKRAQSLGIGVIKETTKLGKVIKSVGTLVPYATAAMEIVEYLLGLFHTEWDATKKRKRKTVEEALFEVLLPSEGKITPEMAKDRLNTLNNTLETTRAMMTQFKNNLENLRGLFTATGTDSLTTLFQNGDEQNPTYTALIAKKEEYKNLANKALVSIREVLDTCASQYFGVSDGGITPVNSPIPQGLFIPQFARLSSVHLLFVAMEMDGGVLNSFSEAAKEIAREKFHKLKKRYQQKYVQLYGSILGGFVGNPFAQEAWRPEGSIKLEEYERQRNVMSGLVMKQFISSYMNSALMFWDFLDDKMYDNELKTNLNAAELSISELSTSWTENMQRKLIPPVSGPPVLSTLIIPSASVDKLTRDEQKLLPFGRKVKLFQGSKQPFLSVIHDLIERHRFVQNVLEQEYIKVTNRTSLPKLYVECTTFGKDTNYLWGSAVTAVRNLKALGKMTATAIRTTYRELVGNMNLIEADEKQLGKYLDKMAKVDSAIEEGISLYYRGVLASIRYYLETDGVPDRNKGTFLLLGGYEAVPNDPVSNYISEPIPNTLIFNDTANPIEFAEKVYMKAKGSAILLGNSTNAQGFSTTLHSETGDVYYAHDIPPKHQVVGVGAYIARTGPENIEIKHWLQNLCVYVEHSSQALGERGHIKKNSLTTIAAKHTSRGVKLLEASEQARDPQRVKNEIYNEMVPWKFQSGSRGGNYELIDQAYRYVDEPVLANEVLYAFDGIRCEYWISTQGNETHVTEDRPGNYRVRLHLATDKDANDIIVRLVKKEKSASAGNPIDTVIKEQTTRIQKQPDPGLITVEGAAGRYYMVDVLQLPNLASGEYMLQVDCPPATALNKIEFIESEQQLDQENDSMPSTLETFGLDPVSSTATSQPQYKITIRPAAGVPSTTYILTEFENNFPGQQQMIVVNGPTTVPFEFTSNRDNLTYTLTDLNDKIVFAKNLNRNIENMTVTALKFPEQLAMDPTKFGFNSVERFEGDQNVITGFSIATTKQAYTPTRYDVQLINRDTNRITRIPVTNNPSTLGDIQLFNITERVPLDQYKLRVIAVYQGDDYIIYQSPETSR